MVQGVFCPDTSRYSAAFCPALLCPVLLCPVQPCYVLPAPVLLCPSLLSTLSLSVRPCRILCCWCPVPTPRDPPCRAVTSDLILAAALSRWGWGSRAAGGGATGAETHYLAAVAATRLRSAGRSALPRTASGTARPDLNY